jgi:hypothetical protein
MPTLLEYFNNDFKDLSLDRVLHVTTQNFDNNENIYHQRNVEIIQRVRQNIDSSVRFFTYYIPKDSKTIEIIDFLLSRLDGQIQELEDTVVIDGFSGDMQIGEHKNIYSNRIYFYTETLLTSEEALRLNEECKSAGIFVTVRSTDYIKTKMEIEKPIAFISHDSRDKDLIARELYNRLNSRLCFVWYDEYSLNIGDSLRESIEDGIKNAKKCVLILTKNYLNNPGWGKKEFNSIFTREMIYNERIVLPIWFGVTKEDIYEYSPSLADTFALTWPSSVEKTQQEYDQEVEQLVSKIHTAIMS